MNAVDKGAPSLFIRLVLLGRWAASRRRLPIALSQPAARRALVFGDSLFRRGEAGGGGGGRRRCTHERPLNGRGRSSWAGCCGFALIDQRPAKNTGCP